MADLTVTINELEWDLVTPDKFTIPECREVKKVVGLTPAELESGLQAMDVDSWLAWFYISIRRQMPHLTMRELEESIGDLPVADLYTSVVQQLQDKEEDAGPPAAAADGGETPEASSATSSDVTPHELIPVTFGDRISSTRT
jgi:hypothetical protein